MSFWLSLWLFIFRLPYSPGWQSTNFSHRMMRAAGSCDDNPTRLNQPASLRKVQARARRTGVMAEQAIAGVLLVISPYSFHEELPSTELRQTRSAAFPSLVPVHLPVGQSPGNVEPGDRLVVRFRRIC